jgi:glucose/arabinose dehydrogenase
MMRRTLFWGLIAALAAPAAGAVTPSDLSLVRYPDANTTFAQPIGVRSANDGRGRVFIIERCGDIRIVQNGVALDTPFLSIDVSCGGEQGLLGLAFDPDYATNGTFYVAYTAPASDPRLGGSPDQVLARYTASSDPNVANPTGTVILRVPDIADNHNGGDIHFDHQGYLAWSMGDGGAQGDPNGFAQCTKRKQYDENPANCGDTSGGGLNFYLLGKIIRLDVHATTASAPSNFCGVPTGTPAPYAIPPGNPFVDVNAHPDDCAEIYNWGFRNPFRFSIDRETGDMLIGDVGQASYEEIDFQPAGSAGQNFQWNICEGFHTYPGGNTPCAGPAGSVPPVLEYSHANGCAIVGGYRYRGPIVAFRGQYVFSDNCSGGINIVADADPSSAPWTYEHIEGAPGLNPYSFGEDDDGNLYVANGAGQVYVFHSGSGSDVIFKNGFE